MKVNRSIRIVLAQMLLFVGLMALGGYNRQFSVRG